MVDFLYLLYLLESSKFAKVYENKLWLGKQYLITAG